MGRMTAPLSGKDLWDSEKFRHIGASHLLLLSPLCLEKTQGSWLGCTDWYDDGRRLCTCVGGCIKAGRLCVHSLNGIVTRGYVENGYAHGIKVRTWTVDNLDQMREVIEMNVDVFVADWPYSGRKVVDRKWSYIPMKIFGKLSTGGWPMNLSIKGKGRLENVLSKFFRKN